MNKFVKKIVKGSKAPNLKITENYERLRKMLDFLHIPKFKMGYEFWDYKVKVKKHEVPIRVFYPKREGTHPVIIFFHGGGWVTGNIDSYTKVCKRLAEETSSIVLSVDYRLAPENKFPIGLMDCYEVTKYILKHAKLFNITKDKIVLMGDSAGGNIAAAVSLRLRDYKEYVPKRQILIYPCLLADHKLSKYKSIKENASNLTLSLKQLDEYIDLYKTREKDKSNSYMSPILARNHKSQPNTLIITAELDILRDEGEDYGKILTKAGNKACVKMMSEVGHGFLRFSKSPTMKETYNLIKEFLKDDIDE